MGLFGPPNVEKMKSKRDIEGLIKTLSYQKVDSVRGAAVDALGQIGDARAVEPLIAALKDVNYYVHTSAAEALVKIGACAVEPLIAALKNVEAGVQRVIEKVLAKIGSPAVEPLIIALKDSEWTVGYHVALALGQIGDARAVEPLINALKSGQGAAAVALGQIGDARTIEPLINALTVKNSHMREDAAVALRQIGARIEDTALCTRAVEPLIAAFKDSEWWVRNGVAGALGAMGARIEDTVLRARVVELLIAALEDSEYFVRSMATVALRQMNNARAVAPSQTQSQYVCAGCGKTLVGDDLAYANKREANARSFYFEVNKPGMPDTIIAVWNLINITFYCHECLNTVTSWSKSAKQCLNCISFLSNFVRMGGMPDFYCRARDNQAIRNPYTDSCTNWQIGRLFRRTD
jgi:HEAT repeat protein